MKKKGELAFDTLIPWLIAAGILVLTVIIYLSLNDKGTSAINYLKNLWRFGS